MSVQKAINANPYGTPPPPDDDVNTQEYRPSVTFSVQKIYKTADRPAAAPGNLGIPIWVTDATPGTQLQYSDGTAWLPLQY